jgi:hypothetical protein
MNTMNQTELIACIHACVSETLAELPEYPCPVNEMTARERQIADAVTQLAGAMMWIRNATELATRTVTKPATCKPKA